MGADIILIRETDFSSSNHPQYFDKTYSQFYCTKTHGVAIFIQNSLVFESHNVYKVPNS